MKINYSRVILCSCTMSASAVFAIKASASVMFPDKIIETSAYESTEDPKWFLGKINAPAFWEKSTGNKSVKVLVCDTGIDSTHPDLQGNISLPGHNFVDGSTNTEPTGNGHGTRVSGLIGAKGSLTSLNATGLNSNVQIVPGKISNDANGMTVHTISAKCIRWAADNGIRIVNLSYSGAVDNPDIQDAADYLYSHNGVLIISSGNEGTQKSFPENPHMIAVTATNTLDWKPPWSNSGEFIDLAAPGSVMYTTDMGGKYITGKGASLATAVVSGAAALILSLRPDLNSEQLTSVILNSTTDMGESGRDSIYGYGILNLKKSLELLGK